MRPQPACFASCRAFVHVQKAIRYQVHVQTVKLMELENAQAAQIGKRLFEQRQQMVPALAGVFDVEHLAKGERPHEQALFAQSLSG